MRKAKSKRINPINDNGSIRLRFAIHGKRYNLGLGGPYGCSHAMGIAHAIAALIELDVRAGIFDPTMKKYRDRFAVLSPGKSKDPLALAC